MFNAHRSTPIEELFLSAIDSKPVSVDGWDDVHPDDFDDARWTYWEAVAVQPFDDETNVSVVYHDGSVVLVKDPSGTLVDPRDHDDYDNIDEDGEDIAGMFTDEQLDALARYESNDPVEGPQMNYWYPLPGSLDEDNAAEAALAILHTNLCVVQVDGTFGLALTGGGMDMTWDIVAGFVQLGYLPPVHFSDLPKMAGDGNDTYVFQAMLRALHVTAQQATQERERLIERFPHLVNAPSSQEN